VLIMMRTVKTTNKISTRGELQKLTDCNRRFKRLAAILFLLVVAGFGLSVKAQDGLAYSPKKGLQAGNSYAAGDIESINTTNGNLMINLPLGGLPAGRGGLSAGVNLMYNSKLWDVYDSYDRTFSCPPHAPECGRPFTRSLSRTEAGGWRYGIDYKLVNLPTSTQHTSSHPCNTGFYDLTRNAVVTPDGEKHELFISTPLSTFRSNQGGLDYYIDGTPMHTNSCWSHSVPRPQPGTVLSFGCNASIRRR
jgi:hypothetical protein